MSIVLIDPARNLDAWVRALQGYDPHVKVEIWPEVRAPEAVAYALCWNQPAGILRKFPNLKAISSLGAGVNHLLNDPTLPPGVPLVRIVDATLKQSMAEYVLLGILAHLRRYELYRQQQMCAEWTIQPALPSREKTIGIMGYGELGRHVGERLSGFGFKVRGWRRSKCDAPSPVLYSGPEERNAFLAASHILVCLLPLTGETANILDAELFAQLPEQAYLINVARGEHLVEEDLLAALASGHLSGALLDVFRDEPLPPEHPFWNHDRITLTPHIASVTDPSSAAAQIIDNYHRARTGEPLQHRVNELHGY